MFITCGFKLYPVRIRHNRLLLHYISNSGQLYFCSLVFSTNNVRRSDLIKITVSLRDTYFSYSRCTEYIVLVTAKYTKSEDRHSRARFQILVLKSLPSQTEREREIQALVHWMTIFLVFRDQSEKKCCNNSRKWYKKQPTAQYLSEPARGIH